MSLKSDKEKKIIKNFILFLLFFFSSSIFFSVSLSHFLFHFSFYFFYFLCCSSNSFLFLDFIFCSYFFFSLYTFFLHQTQELYRFTMHTFYSCYLKIVCGKKCQNMKWSQSKYAITAPGKNKLNTFSTI